MNILKIVIPMLLVTTALMMPVANGQTPKMKMTTDIPPGIATPDKLETRLGTLTSVDGVPDAATAQKVFDNLDFQRATQAYLNSFRSLLWVVCVTVFSNTVRLTLPHYSPKISWIPRRCG